MEKTFSRCSETPVSRINIEPQHRLASVFKLETNQKKKVLIYHQRTSVGRTDAFCSKSYDQAFIAWLAV